MAKRRIRNARPSKDDKVEINVNFADDYNEKSADIDENLSAPGVQEQAESPKGSPKTNFTKQVADAVFGSKVRASFISILSKSAQYSGDYLTINNINNAGLAYSFGSSMSKAIFKGSYFDVASLAINQALQMVDVQMQKDKENLKAEAIRNKTGLSSYMKSRMAGKKI